MIAWPSRTSIVPPSCSTRSMPRSTTVYSQNSGRCRGSVQPPGERMWAMLSAVVALLTRPTYSSISFGLFPAASIRVGRSMCFGMRGL